MKIICIGQNYRRHIKELGGVVPGKPVFFLKPDTALLKDGNPFFMPSFSNDLHHEVELVFRISRLGKSIPEKFAGRYYREVTLGIDFTARDLQRHCKENGLPWEIAKAFDGSAAIGRFIPLVDLGGTDRLEFWLEINGRMVQQGTGSDMIFSIDQVISYVSGFITLRTGDLFFTGTPEGVGAVRRGDRLQGYLCGTPVLDFYVR